MKTIPHETILTLATLFLSISIDPATCRTEHLYRTINGANDLKAKTKNITLNCPLIAGNPATEQSVCWFFANKSSVEYCDELNRTLTLFDLLADEPDSDLTSTAGVSNNDEDNALDTKDKDKDPNVETGRPLN